MTEEWIIWSQKKESHIYEYKWSVGGQTGTLQIEHLLLLHFVYGVLVFSLTHAHTFTCMHACTHTHYAHMHPHTYAHMHPHTYMHTCTHTHMHTCTHTHMHTCTHTHIHMHTHIHNILCILHIHICLHTSIDNGYTENYADGKQYHFHWQYI